MFFLDSLDNCRKPQPNDGQQAFDIDTMRQQNLAVRAFVHVADTPAQDAAAQSRPTALLTGVPVAVKDLIDVAGMPTRLGCKAIDRRPVEHAEVIQTLLREGAVIPGKSHTTEFAMSGWGVSPLGRPLNAISASDEFFPGGSSNGSAAAIAAGLVPAALGTDTGGSVRIPSSWCGITGLKGSPSWVSTRGVAALSQSFDTVGPMARTATEAAQLYRAMLPNARRAALEAELLQSDTSSLPALVFVDDASLGDIHPDTLSAYRASQEICKTQGFTVTTHPIPCAFSDMASIWAGISGLEGYLNNKALVDDPNAPLDDAVRKNFLLGGQTTTEAYFLLLNRARECREKMEQLLAPGQLLVVPTTSSPATRLTEFDAQRTLGIYTRFVNLIQGCAIAVPNGLSADARPTSMQFVGAYAQDAVILRAAMHWQAHTDWHQKIRQQHFTEVQALAAQHR